MEPMELPNLLAGLSIGENTVKLLQRYVLIGSADGMYTAIPPQQSKKRKSAPDEDKKVYEQIRGETSVLNPFLDSNAHCLMALDILRDIYDKRYFITKEYLLKLLARIVRSNVKDNGNDHSFDRTRDQAYKFLLEVCQTSNDLFVFVNQNKQNGIGGKVSWGRGLRTMITEFYERKTPVQLARDVMHCKKFRDFEHRDLIRQCHLQPKKKGKGTELILGYLAKEKEAFSQFRSEDDDEVKEILNFLKDVHSLKSKFGDDKDKISNIIQQHRLSFDQVPTNCRQFKQVYQGLLEHEPASELIQHIPKMATLQMLNDDQIVEKLIERLRPESLDDKISPVAVMNIIHKYKNKKNKKKKPADEEKQNSKKNFVWSRNPKITESLENVYKESLVKLPKNASKFLLLLDFDNEVKVSITGLKEMKAIHVCALLTQSLQHVTDNLKVVLLKEQERLLSLSADDDNKKVLDKINQAAGPGKKGKDAKQTQNKQKEKTTIKDCMEWAENSEETFDNIVILSPFKQNIPADKDKKAEISAEIEKCFKESLKNLRTKSPHVKVALIGLDGKSKLPIKDDINYLDICGFNENVLSLLLKYMQGFPQQ